MSLDFVHTFPSLKILIFSLPTLIPRNPLQFHFPPELKRNAGKSTEGRLRIIFGCIWGKHVNHLAMSLSPASGMRNQRIGGAEAFIN